MLTRIYERVLATGTEEEIRRTYEFMSAAERCTPFYDERTCKADQDEWDSFLAWIEANGGKIPEDENLPFN